MAVEYNRYRNNAVVMSGPTLPTLTLPSQNKYDPEAYYTKALGLFSIDTRYLSNTTNSLAYNSMADVLFNKAAWDKRWNDKPFMQGWLNPLRIVADTALLIKDTTVDPIVANVQQDGLSGLGRGLSTAGMNALINFGNTMDILANPIKGFFIEGGKGITKGLFGDEHGRKQYDYSEHWKPTSSGGVNFLLQLGAEILSDPTTWLSLGVGALAKLGVTGVSKTAAIGATDFLTTAVKQGVNVVDDIAETGVKTFSQSAIDGLIKSTGDSITEDTAKIILNQVTDKSGKLVSEAVEGFSKNVDNLTNTVIKQNIRRGAFDEATLKKTAEGLMQSKGTRYKAGLIKKVDMTPAAQRFVSETLPGITIDQLPSSLRLGLGMAKTANTIDKTLATIGTSGANLAIVKGAKSAAKGISNAVNMRRLQKAVDAGVKNTVDAFAKLDLQKVNYDQLELPEDVILKFPDAKVHDAIDDTLTDLIDEFNVNLMHYDESVNLIKKQSEIAEAFDNTIAQNTGFKSFKEYADYIHDLTHSYRLKEFDDNTIAQLKILDARVDGMYRVLHTDLNAPGQLEIYKRIGKFYKEDVETYNTKFTAQPVPDDISKLPDDATIIEKPITESDEVFNRRVGTLRTNYQNLFKDDAFVRTVKDMPTQPVIGAEAITDLFHNFTSDLKTTRGKLLAPRMDVQLKESIEGLIDTARHGTADELTMELDDIRGFIGEQFNYIAERTPKLNERLSNADNIMLLRKLKEVYEGQDKYYIEDLIDVSRNLFDGPADIADYITNFIRANKELLGNHPMQRRRLYKLADMFEQLGEILTGSFDVKMLEDFKANYLDNSTIQDAVLSFDFVNKYTGATASDIYIKQIDKLALQKSPAFRAEWEAFKKLSDLERVALINPQRGTEIVKTFFGPEGGLQEINLKAGKAAMKERKAELATVKTIKEIPDSVLDDATQTIESWMGHNRDDMFELNDDGTLEYIPVEEANTFNKLEGELFPKLDEHWDAMRGYPNTTMDVDSKVYVRNHSALNEAYSSFKTEYDAFRKIEHDYFIAKYNKHTVSRKLTNKYRAAQREVVEAWDDFKRKHLLPLTRFQTSGEDLTITNAVQVKNQIEQPYLGKNPSSELGLSAKDLIDYIEELPEFNLKDYTQYVDVAHFEKAELFQYVLKGSQTRFALDLVEDVTNGLAKVLDEFADETSPLHAYLNDANIAKEVDVDAVKHTLTKQQAFRTLVERLRVFSEKKGLDPVRSEKLLDAIVTEINTERPLRSWNIQQKLHDIFTSMELGYKSSMDKPSLALDNVYREAIKNNNSPAAISIASRLKNAHGAATDVDNLIDYLELAPDLKKALDNTAGDKYRVFLDIETTGAHKTGTIYQLAVVVKTADGSEVFKVDYKINPGNARPDPVLLKKLAEDGYEPQVWWDTVVKKNYTTNLQDALADFNNKLTSLDPEKSFIFVGHNIDEFDMKELAKAATDPNIKKLFTDPLTFDTYLNMTNLNMYSMPKTNQQHFLAELGRLLLKNEDCFGEKLFEFRDMWNLSEFKKAVKSDLDFEKDVKVNLDVKTELSQNYRSVDYLNELLDEPITNIVNSWNGSHRIKRINDTHYYTLSKALVDSNDMQQTINSLIAQGLINVPEGKNIMQFLNRYVKSENVFLNPKTVISNEMFNNFDIKKISNKFNGTVVNRKIAEELTTHSRAIARNKIWINQDMVDATYEEAKAFLQAVLGFKDFKDVAYIKLLYDVDTMDPTTLVATAKHFSDRYTALTLTENPYESAFGNLFQYTKDYDNTVTPFGYRKDPITDIPVEAYETDAFNYVELAKKSKDLDELDVINKYNTDHNIFQAHTAALHNMHQEDIAIARAANTAVDDVIGNTVFQFRQALQKGNEFEEYVQMLPQGKRSKLIGLINRKHFDEAEKYLEKEIKPFLYKRMYEYEDRVLVNQAKKALLDGTDRVQRFIDNAYVHGGIVTFKDKAGLDLSDFEKAGVVVMTKPTADVINTTEYWLGLPTELFLKANKDADIGVHLVKAKNYLPDDLAKVIDDNRLHTGGRVKNVGYSHGDVFTKELADELRDAAPNGFADKVITVNELMALKQADGTVVNFFNTTRANNAVIGDATFQRQFNEYFVRDPFRRNLYNTEAYVRNQHNDFTSFLNLLYNKHNGITTSDLFKNLKDEDLLILLKEHPEMKLVYVRPADSKLRTTTFGYILEEVPLTLAAIKKAREINAHVVPIEQYMQITKAINTWELPKIAKFAKNISSLYAVGMLGASGYIIRNLIDSNYKNRVALEGVVSLPDQIKHLWSTYKIINKYNNLGQVYSKYTGKFFTRDIDYSVFYNTIKHIDDSDVATAIIKEYAEKYRPRVEKQVNKLLEQFKGNFSELKSLQKDLIEPELFDVVNMFIQHGPSAGLTRSIVDNISKTTADKQVVNKLIDFYTTKTPAKLVFSANDMVEQSARLSLFLQRVGMGDSVNEALSKVIKTHFDYSDKSLAMLYAEIVFPFMSFSYKNLNYWIEALSKNPATIRELENILRTCLDYQSLWEPNQEVYEDYDYTFDWSKNVTSFQANAPWQMINAARLHHLLQGNIVIDTGKTVKRDKGYGVQEYELYDVFKLSPSVLDAVKMLYNPIDVYTQRTLPPYEVLASTFLKVLNGEAPLSDVGVNTVLNNLPLIGAPLQRLGTKSNNMNTRVKDLGLHQAITSLYTAAYVPKKDDKAWYDAEFKYLNKLPQAEYYNNAYYHRQGGFTPIYSIRRLYADPYQTNKPMYHITKLARGTTYRYPYMSSKYKRVAQDYTKQYRNALTDYTIRFRLRDRFRYY